MMLVNLIWLLSSLVASLKVLQLTDIHLDPHYQPAASLISFCHRPAQEPFDQERAGEYGSHGCDSPVWLLERALSQIKSEHDDLDLIIVTGDNGRHDFDDLIKISANEVLWSNLKVHSLLRSHFPQALIVFSIGNNDVSLHDSLDSGPNGDLKGLADAWEIQQSSFQSGGFYALDVNEALTVISLNTLAFSQSNLFARDCNHPHSLGSIHLKWLQVQLRKLEEKGKRVVIVGHIPAQSRFFHPTCLKEYNRLLYRHRHTVLFQIFGHIHEDTFFLSRHKRIPSVPALIAPSFSPVFNPAYRVFNFTKNGDLCLENILQYYAPGDHSTFTLEYNTSEAYLKSPLIDTNSLLKLEKISKDDCRVKLMLNRFRYVCY